MARPAHRPVACPKARVNPVRPYNSRRALRRRLLARISVRPNILTSIGCAVAIVGTTTLAQDVYVTLCRVRFVVTDAQARIVPHLGPDDLVVLDNNIPQQLAEFHERSNAGLRLAVILDRSQSVSDQFKFLTDAAATIVTTIVHQPDDQALLVAFDSKPYLLRDWTSDARLIADDLRKVTSAGGSSIFDALLKTCRDKLAEDDDPRRKVVVLITDGEDTTSVATFDETLAAIRQAKVVVEVVAVHTQNSMNTADLQGERVLARLADLSGGRVWYPDLNRKDEPVALSAKLDQELRNWYDASYYLHVPPDDSFHRIRIEPKDKSLTVRAPLGYYAWKLPRGH